ncbi:MAG TPA: zf-HC2 domain-containing protein [Ktedonobacteraceae bacterium]|nr:zf-HC2 domain-containing protein [Ktedonobacteraceae bacterium]
MNEFQQPEHNDYCLDENMLTAHRDGELALAEEEHVTSHLTECAGCATHERSVINNGHEIYGLLAALAPLQEAEVEPVPVLARMQARIREEGHEVERPKTLNSLTANMARRQRWYRRPRSWVAAVAAAIILAMIALPNAGVLADQFLSLFRVQQFQPITINPQDFRSQPLPGLQDFGTAKLQGANMQDNLTEAQAAQLVHFHILLPTYVPKGVSGKLQYSVMTGGDVTFTFNSSSTRAYLDKNGGKNIVIPANLNGATFTITVAAGVEMQYNSDNTVPFLIVEVPSPIIRATGAASLNELRDFLLSLPNIPPSLASQLKSIDINSGTIPIPLPPQVTAQHVTIHGVPGLLLADNTPIGGAVVWQTHGMIYAVGGAVGNATQLMETANSLR